MQTKIFIPFIFIYIVSINAIFSNSEKELEQDLKTSILHNLDDYFKTNESLEALQLLCNIFLRAIDYSQLDIKLNKIKQKLVFSILSLKNSTSDNKSERILKRINTLIKKLNKCKEKHTIAHVVWDKATHFLDQPEQKKAADIMKIIALERLMLLEKSLESHGEQFIALISNLKNDFQQSALRINSLGNCFQALNDDALPLSKKTNYKNLEKLELANTFLLSLEKETLLLNKNNAVFAHYYDSMLQFSLMIDNVYYQSMHEYLMKNSSEKYQMIMFNLHGLIPEDQRTELLPHVVH
jgi:hypothetical protein